MAKTDGHGMAKTDGHGLKPGDAEFSPRVEGALAELYAAGDPAPSFIVGLERQLMAVHPVKANATGRATATGIPAGSPWGRPVAVLWQRRWAQAVVLLLLIVVLALAALGPQRVLADIQRLLWRYVPGLGFIETSQARLLVEPVTVSRDGMTLRLAQVVAQNDETVVSLTVDGLPQVTLPERNTPGLEASLELPDGHSLALVSSSYSWNQAQLRFPALPAGVMSATLSLPRLPLATAGQLPEGWRMPFILRPAASAVAADVFPQAYEPAGAEATHNGVTMRVLRVAHSAEATAVQLETRWQNRTWALVSFGDRQLPTLADDLGHVYGEPPALRNTGGAAITREGAVTTVQQVTVVQVQPGTPSQLPPPGVAERTLTFSPASAAARRLRLEINAVRFMADSPGESTATPFTLNLGDAPQVGQRWRLDQWLSVEGFRVHLTGASLEQASVQHVDGSSNTPSERPAYLLRFEVDPLPTQTGARLDSVCFGPPPGAAQPEYGSHCGDAAQAPGIMFGQLPAGQLALEATAGSILVNGPWELAWDVPAGAANLPPAAEPRVVRPGDTTATASGLTLRLESAVLTDRVTALKLELENAGGAELYRLPGRLPGRGLTETVLRDEAGRRYRFAEGIGWGAYGGLMRRPGALYLEPLAAPAARLQLDLPSIEVRVPVRAAFDVQVPTGIQVDRSNGLAYSPGRPPKTSIFDIDIPLDLDGYHLRFRRVGVSAGNGGGLLTLEEASPDLGGGRRVAGYCVASVTTPGGQPARPGSGALPDEQCDFALGFAVGDPDTGVVEPGTYHVELDGLVIAVPGPWRLTFSTLR